MKNSNFIRDLGKTNLTGFLIRLTGFSGFLLSLIWMSANPLQAQYYSDAPKAARSGRSITNHKQILLERSQQQESRNREAASATNPAIPALGNPGDLDASFNASILSDAAAVEAIATQPNGKILVGGEFTAYNGTARRNLVRLNPDGSLDASFSAEINGGVHVIVLLADGKILIGGSFTRVNGAARGNAARLNSDGTLDSAFNFSAGTDATVFDMKPRPDGKIVIGGDFTTVNNVPRSRIAQLNNDGSLDTTFDAGAGPNNAVYGLDLQADGKVLITGLFNEVAGAERRQLARLNANGSLDSFNFNEINFFGGVGYDVVVQPDGKILVGGFFQNFFQDILLLVRLNPDGSGDGSFNEMLGDFLDEYVEQIALQPDGKILVGGFFPNPSENVARLNANGTADATFNPGGSANSSVEAIGVQTDGKVLVGGLFTNYQGTARSRLARLHPNAALDTSFNAGGSNITKVEPGTIYASVVQPDGKILIGGFFQQVNGAARYNIARLNADGSVDTSFNPGIGTRYFPGSFTPVYAIALTADNQIIIGGRFPTYNGQFVDNLARLNPNGSLDQDLTSFTDAAVHKLLVQPDGKILVGGRFRYVSNIWRRYITRLDANGELDFSFNAGNGPNNSGLSANSNIFDFALQPDGKIVIAGQFQQFNGAPRNRIARLNANGTLDATFAPDGGADATVWSVTVQPDAKILIAGSFTSVNGTPRNRIARLNSDGSLDAAFNPGTGANRTVYDVLPQPDGKLLLGGEFTEFNNAARSSLARLNADGSLDSTYTNGTNGVVRNIISYPENKVIISGFFSEVNGTPRTSIARLNPQSAVQPPRAMFDFDGDGKSDIAVFRPADGVWYLNRSSQGFTAVQFGISTDKLAPADFDGDGKTDLAVYRDNTWYLLRSTAGFTAVQFGAAGDIPQPADFDGDGRAELAVFRPTTGTWYVLNLVNGQFNGVQFGANGDKPVAADYDGDGKTDYAVYRPVDGTWYLLRSQAGFTGVQFGISTDKPVVGDYDGDGKADPAVYRDGVWYQLRSSQGFTAVQFGIQTDLPAPADFDGDGKTDPAVYRDNTWYLLQSTNGFTGVQFGAIGDKPVSNAFVQ